MPSPNVTLAIVLQSVTERYGDEFTALLVKASGCDGKSGLVYMTAGMYADLLIEWSTNGEGPETQTR